MVKISDKDVPPPLSAKDKSSFAYKTIKDRLPVIIVKTIDFFHRQRKDLPRFDNSITSPEEAEVEAKLVISELTKLRKDLETNKAVTLLEPVGDLPPQWEYFNDDIQLWNRALEANRLLEDDNSLPKYFDSPWLLVECYLYRRIKDILLRTKHLKMFDPFVEQKQAALLAQLPQMHLLASHLIQVLKVYEESDNFSHPSERSEFSLFMQLSLWANKCDLSITCASVDKLQANKLASDLRESVESHQENILCDNLSDAWFKFQSIKERVNENIRLDNMANIIYIDLVVDNAGYELFVDLCLIHFLSLLICGGRENVSAKFRIHVKSMPWFVSDAMRQDVSWLMKILDEKDPAMQVLARRWKGNFDTKFWEICEHKYWTLPNDFSEMQATCPDLYRTFQVSSMIIFKGDLNYRKLTGDRKWHLLTPFRNALRGFEPAPLISLRTAKADVVVGIEDINIFAKINNNELPRDWMISGDFGLIQFSDPM